MPYLDSALAFAFTMFIVATVVTKIVDLLNWLLRHLPDIAKDWFGERCKLFGKMADEFLEKELSVIVAREKKGEPDASMDECKNAIKQIITAVGGGKVLAGLSNADLLDKFKQTDLGKELVGGLGNRAAEVLDEISRRYAAIEKKYTEIFRTKARAIATVVALILAFACNIDSINILGTYLGDPALTARVTAKIEQVTADHHDLISKKDPADGKAISEQVKDQYAAIQTELSKLNANEFPFGHSYKPYGNKPSKSWNIWVWLAGIFVTAFCAGMGAPFWHDAIRSLTQMTRGGKSSTPTITPS